jgi:hypothetical protein
MLPLRKRYKNGTFTCLLYQYGTALGPASPLGPSRTTPSLSRLPLYSASVSIQIKNVTQPDSVTFLTHYLAYFLKEKYVKIFRREKLRQKNRRAYHEEKYCEGEYCLNANELPKGVAKKFESE